MPKPKKPKYKLGDVVIKVGDKVKTRKGDANNMPYARKEILKVLQLKNGWKGMPAALCLKSNGKKDVFLLKNLYKV